MHREPERASLARPGRRTPRRARARSSSRLVAGEVGKLGDLRAGAHEHAAAVDENRHAEIDVLHPRQRDRRRAAFGVDAARLHRFEAIRRIDGLPDDLQRRQLQALLDRRRDRSAELGRVAAHVAVAVGVRERRRVIAIGERDRSAVADAVERRARCARLRGEAESQHQNAQRLGSHRWNRALAGTCSSRPRAGATASVTERCVGPVAETAPIQRPSQFFPARVKCAVERRIPQAGNAALQANS